MFAQKNDGFVIHGLGQQAKYLELGIDWCRFLSRIVIPHEEQCIIIRDPIKFTTSGHFSNSIVDPDELVRNRQLQLASWLYNASSLNIPKPVIHDNIDLLSKKVIEYHQNNGVEYSDLFQTDLDYFFPELLRWWLGLDYQVSQYQMQTVPMKHQVIQKRRRTKTPIYIPRNDPTLIKGKICGKNELLKAINTCRAHEEAYWGRVVRNDQNRIFGRMQEELTRQVQERDLIRKEFKKQQSQVTEALATERSIFSILGSIGSQLAFGSLEEVDSEDEEPPP